MHLTPHQAKYIAHDLNPHQLEAAVFALRSPLSKGVLLDSHQPKDLPQKKQTPVKTAPQKHRAAAPGGYDGFVVHQQKQRGQRAKPTASDQPSEVIPVLLPGQVQALGSLCATDKRVAMNSKKRPMTSVTTPKNMQG